MSVHPVRYCFDTSGLLDGWVRYYPIKNFPSLWDRVANLFTSGRAYWPEEVLGEIRDADLLTWLDQFSYCQMTTASVWADAQRIQQQYNPNLTRSSITGADSFLIASAIRGSLCIITGEVHSNGPPKIPNVCMSEGIDSANFTSLIDREGWAF